MTAPKTIVVGGPTASGKSALAIALAERLGGELICADSRQVYAGLSIAAAGPSDEERERVAHHLFGATDPRTPASAGTWLTAADTIIREIHDRHHVAIVVGGTGLYLRALRLGLDEAAPTDSSVRQKLEDDLQREGLPVLVERLRALDAEALTGLDTKNPVRVLRALEIKLLGGNPTRDIGALLLRPPRSFVADASWLLLDAPLSWLEPRIRNRAEQMFAAGLVEEARLLRERLPANHPLLATLGTAEALALVAGQISTNAAIDTTALRTRQYARRQRTWFKKEPWWRQLDARGATVQAALSAIAG